MSERKKVRHFLNRFLGFISGSAVFSILLALWILFGVFQEGLFQESLEKSGYYEALYQNWKTQVDAKLEEIAVPADAVDEEALKLRFMVEIKNQSGMWAAGDEIGEMVYSYFEENKLGLTQKAEAGFSSWKQEINVLTCDMVKIPFVKTWNQKRTDMIQLLPDVLLKMIAIWGVSVVILFFMQHFKHRSFRYAGYASFTAGLVMMIFCGMMWMFENRTCAEWLLHIAIYEMNHITYADFLPAMEVYLRQVWRNGLYLGSGGMLVGAFGVALSYLLRKY